MKKCLSKWTEFIFWINRSGCYICRMSCQQLYIEEKIQIIFYTAKYMLVRFNYDYVSFERGGAWEKMRTEWGGGGGMVIGNGDSKNSTNPPYLVKNERSLSKLLAGMTSAPPLIAGTTWVNLGPGTKKFGSYKEVIVLNILKYKYCVGKSRNLELLTNWWRVQERKSSNYMCLIYIKHF